jgi:pimeloyl-ACP methyl ester carboxylesterase
VTATRTSYNPGGGFYPDVNGIKLYYETHGSGGPMLLLHGGLFSSEMFGPILPTLAKKHQVIAVDLQGHGRTAGIDTPLNIGVMADDIAALIDHLGLERPDLVGYSLVGGVAFMTASRYPDKVRRLVTACVYLRPDVVDPALLAQQGQVNAAAAPFMKDTPMYQLYQRVAPRPENFGRLLDKIGAMMSESYDYTEEFRSLKVPTLLVASDADQAPPSHYAEMFTLLDGGLRDGGWMGENRPTGGHALAILPGLTHYNLFASPLFAAVILEFLDEDPAPA